MGGAVGAEVTVHGVSCIAFSFVLAGRNFRGFNCSSFVGSCGGNWERCWWQKKRLKAEEPRTRITSVGIAA